MVFVYKLYDMLTREEVHNGEFFLTKQQVIINSNMISSFFALNSSPMTHFMACLIDTKDVSQGKHTDCFKRHVGTII